MPLPQIISIGSFLVGIAGLGLGIYQRQERRKLSVYVRSQAWYLYGMANNALAHTQEAHSRYLEACNDPADSKTLIVLTKADAYGQDLLMESIRQIQLAEPRFAKAQFDQWESEGKMRAEHRPLFDRLCVEPSHAEH